MSTASGGVCVERLGNGCVNRLKPIARHHYQHYLVEEAIKPYSAQYEDGRGLGWGALDDVYGLAKWLSHSVTH